MKKQDAQKKTVQSVRGVSPEAGIESMVEKICVNECKCIFAIILSKFLRLGTFILQKQPFAELRFCRNESVAVQT